MPLIIHCANEPYCQNYVERLGDLCEECKRKAKNNRTCIDKHAENAERWKRSKSNGHKKAEEQ